MEPITIGYIGLAILLILIFSGMPLGAVMGIVGLLGVVYAANWQAGLGLLQRIPFDSSTNADLTCVPLFILMGEFCFWAGISEDLFNTLYKWVGGFRGGLALATISGCAGFAAVSGSSLATAVTMGTVALPEMKKYRYNDALATGCIAAGGTMGILIPPSIILAIYGILTQQSIGKLFLAGFIPGILQAIFYIGVVYVLCRRNPALGPPGPSTTWKEKLVSIKGIWIVLALFALVIGGLYVGIFSPTEAAGVGAAGAFIFALFRRRLSGKNLWSSLTETGRTTGMIFLIVIGANLLGGFLAVTNLPTELAASIAALPVNRYIILGIIIIIYLFLGCVMDSMAMILLTVPIFFPIITQLGFNGIWFGIIVTRMIEIGMITPPVGLNVFIIQGVAKDVPMGTIFRGILPFFISDLFHVTLLVSVPVLSLLLPNLIK